MNGQTPGQAAYEAFRALWPVEDWGPWDRLLPAPMSGEDHPHAGWDSVSQAAVAAQEPAPELAAAVAENRQLRSWLDDFTRLVLNLGEARVCRPAEVVRGKAGLPPVDAL